MPFFNARLFLAEAVESVIAQTFPHWELLLVDDGSDDGGTEVALQYAASHGLRIRYLAHPGDENRGASAARNLGLKHARGEFIAFLDADDVFLPKKLEEQVRLLDERPEAGMVCNATRVWYGWTGVPADARRDHVLPIGPPPGSLLPPGELLTQMFRERAHAPCTCSVLVRKSVIERAGAFDECFRRVFTDQVFFAKLLLGTWTYVADGCWDWYRQHPNSACAVTDRTGEALEAERAYLAWLDEHLRAEGWENSPVWVALQSYVWWRHRHPALYRIRAAGRRATRAILRAPRALARGIGESGYAGGGRGARRIEHEEDEP